MKVLLVDLRIYGFFFVKADLLCSATFNLKIEQVNRPSASDFPHASCVCKTNFS